MEKQTQKILWGLLISGLFLNSPITLAGTATDSHGNIGYDTQAECDAAVAAAAGDVKYYQSFTTKPPLKRKGEVSVKTMVLRDLSGITGDDNFNKGFCDIGVGRSNNRDGVAAELIGNTSLLIQR